MAFSNKKFHKNDCMYIPTRFTEKWKNYPFQKFYLPPKKTFIIFNITTFRNFGIFDRFSKPLLLEKKITFHKIFHEYFTIPFKYNAFLVPCFRNSKKSK